MIENLKIENFGPIKNVNLDLKRVFVLIGPQSSGKSVIAKLIAIFRDWDFVIDKIPFVELLKKHNIDSYLNDKSIISYTSDPFSFIYREEVEDFVYNESHELNNLLKRYKSIVALNSNDSSSPDKLQLDETIKYINTKIKSLSKDKKEDSSKLESFETLVEMVRLIKTSLSSRESAVEKAKQEIQKFVNFSEYVPAERILIPIISNSTLSFTKLDIPLPKNLIDFGSSFEKAREELNEVDINFLNIKYKFSQKENKIYLKNKKSILLNRASSGFQAVIPMLLVITHLSPNSNHGHTFVIEEPEQNLFPETQSHLVKFLTEHCTKHDNESGNFNELVITTHSPYVLTSFNNLLLANKVSANKEIGIEVDKIVPKQFWIKQNNFNAYYIVNGKASQIFDEQLGLISENELDSASEYIMNEFNQLMDLRRATRYAK